MDFKNFDKISCQLNIFLKINVALSDNDFYFFFFLTSKEKIHFVYSKLYIEASESIFSVKG